MKAILVRVGADQKFGQWNAPVDPGTGRFIYMPIPEKSNLFHPGMERRFEELCPDIQRFADDFGLDVDRDLRPPLGIRQGPMHLDPDFAHLTYGDQGKRRGAGMWTLAENDLLVFYAGLRSIHREDQRLIYALVGLYVVKEVPVKATAVPADRWHENAHTRKANMCESDLVIRAKEGVSGRLERCIPIGEWRDKAYRVRRDLLNQWGGLSVNDGYIQRSAVPPCFLHAQKFFDWFKLHEIPLLQRIN